MKVVLLEDVKRLGSRGDVCEVSDGYALNFLAPQKKAVEVKDEQGVRVAKEHKEKKNIRDQKVQERKKVVHLIPESITLQVSANDKGTLFSAITAENIVEHLGEKGIPTAPKQFLMEPIKEIGSHTIHIKDGEKPITVIIKRSA